MAKVTVYVSDEQLDKLRRIKRFSRGGVSRAFQTFIDEMESGGGGGRYDYARRLMPVSASIERARKALAGKVSDGGPPADGGPIAAALTILVYRHLVDQQPDLEDVLRTEFARFGLDDLVGTETEGIDLLAEPPEDETGEEDEDDDDAPLGIFGAINLAKELRDIGSVLRDSGVLHVRTRHGSQTAIRVRPEDDPRDLLSARDFDSFKERHPDWSDEQELSQDEIRTITRLLRGRFRGDERRERGEPFEREENEEADE